MLSDVFSFNFSATLNLFFCLVSSLTGTSMGHSRPGALSKEHGGALLPQRARCRICVRRHKNGLIPEPKDLDSGVQRARGVILGPSCSGGKQMRSSRPDPGPFQHCP